MVLTLEHSCADYAAWRVVFDGHGDVRRTYGCTSERVYRDADDPNRVAVMLEFPDADTARRFLADPSLADAMRRGGDGATAIAFGDTVTPAGF